MNDLETRLDALTNTEIVEAAGFYLSEDVGYQNTEGLAGQLTREAKARGGDSGALFQLLEAVKNDTASSHYLLRDVLGRAARGTAAEQQRLRAALDGLNQNQLAIELMFAIYAASVVTIIWLSMPPTETTTTTTTEYKVDGTIVTSSTTMVKEIPPPVKELYGWIRNLPGTKTDT